MQAVHARRIGVTWAKSEHFTMIFKCSLTQLARTNQAEQPTMTTKESTPSSSLFSLTYGEDTKLPLAIHGARFHVTAACGQRLAIHSVMRGARRVNH